MMMILIPLDISLENILGFETLPLRNQRQEQLIFARQVVSPMSARGPANRACPSLQALKRPKKQYITISYHNEQWKTLV